MEEKNENNSDSVYKDIINIYRSSKHIGFWHGKEFMNHSGDRRLMADIVTVLLNYEKKISVSYAIETLNAVIEILPRLAIFNNKLMEQLYLKDEGK